MTPDVITISARPEVWKAVLRALRASPEANPFYQVLVSEVESAYDDWLDEQLKVCD